VAHIRDGNIIVRRDRPRVMGSSADDVEYILHIKTGFNQNKEYALSTGIKIAVVRLYGPSRRGNEKIYDGNASKRTRPGCPQKAHARVISIPQRRAS